MRRNNVVLTYNRLDQNIQELESTGKTVVIFVINNVARLLISLEEEHLAKPDSKAVVSYLQNEMKMKVAMITGDNQHTALKVANYVGIPEALVTAKAYPHQKKNVVKKFQAQGEVVMFVGDGVNDSLVLAQADIGVAIAAAADITVQAASIICLKDNLQDVVNAIRISRLTMQRI